MALRGAADLAVILVLGVMGWAPLTFAGEADELPPPPPLPPLEGGTAKPAVHKPAAAVELSAIEEQIALGDQAEAKAKADLAKEDYVSAVNTLNTAVKAWGIAVERILELRKKPEYQEKEFEGYDTKAQHLNRKSRNSRLLISEIELLAIRQRVKAEANQETKPSHTDSRTDDLNKLLARLQDENPEATAASAKPLTLAELKKDVNDRFAEITAEIGLLKHVDQLLQAEYIAMRTDLNTTMERDATEAELNKLSERAKLLHLRVLTARAKEAAQNARDGDLKKLLDKLNEP